MPPIRLRLDVEASDSMQVFSRSQRLHGIHSVPVADLLHSDFMLQNTDFDTFESMRASSGLQVASPSTDETNIKYSQSWDELIAGTSRFSSWDEMRQAAAADWVKRQLLAGAKSRRPVQSPTPGAPRSDKEITTETRTLSLHAVPLDRIRLLVEAGLAQRFTQGNEDVVVTPLLIDGTPKQVAFRRKSNSVIYPPIGPGGHPAVSIGPDYFEIAGFGPAGFDPARLADTTVFSRLEADRLQGVVGTLQFVLHFVPAGAVADYLILGEGTRTDAFISALGDASLAFGMIAKLAGNTRQAILLARVAGGIDVSIGVYRYSECVVLGANGQFAAGAAKAGEATLLLLGGTSLIQSRLNRGAWKEIDVFRRGELLEHPDLKNLPFRFPYFDDWDRGGNKIAVSLKSVDLRGATNLKSTKNGLREEIKRITDLPLKVQHKGYIVHKGKKIALDEIKGVVLKVIVEPGEMRKIHREMFAKLQKDFKKVEHFRLEIVERR